MKKVLIKKQPVVLLNMYKNDEQLPYLVALAKEHDWRFFDLDITKGIIPAGFEIMGGIVNTLPDSQETKALLGLGCPVVRIGSLPHPQDHLQPVVMADLFAAGQLAAEHFAARGFRDIAYIGNIPWANRKHLYKGFLKRGDELEMNTHLLKLRVPVFDTSKNGMDAYKRMRQDYKDTKIRSWLKALPKPVGIFAYHDGLAIQIHLQCLSLNLTVPGEISILSYDNTSRCETAILPISSIDPGREAIAREAVALLHKMIKGYTPDPPQVWVKPTGVVLRQSTDILAVSDPNVAKALTFIWENLALPLSVDDVAESTGVPLRTLSRAFKKCLDRTINEELRRKRMETACGLLRNSSMTVAQIIKAVGFSSNAYFHKRFHEEFGMTPTAFRTTTAPSPQVRI